MNTEIIKPTYTETFLLVIKEVLSPLQYFIVYHNFFCIEPKSLQELASTLNTTIGILSQIKLNAINKIKPFIDDSQKSIKTLNKIKNREGKKFSILKSTPLSPDAIIKYLYVKDDLTDLEKKLYELIIISEYNYTDADYATELDTTAEELQQLMISLKTKINYKFSDIKSFSHFKEQIIKKYSNNIFTIPTNSKDETIEYQSLEEKYSSLSLEEILNYFKESNYTLTKKEEKLLKKFFSIPNTCGANEREIEKEINILKFDFKRIDQSKHINNLYNMYQTIKNEFSEIQQLYLECFVFGKKSKEEFKKRYPNHKVDRSKLLNLLEKKYYHIFEYFENNFTKEKWLQVSEKYSHRFSSPKLEILDLYFGVFDRPYSVAEIAYILNMDSLSVRNLFQPALELAIRLYSGVVSTLEIDRDVYIPYVLQPYYDFVPETREILKLYLIENKTYEEISELKNLSKTRISNIITSGIRKIDFYRFKINEPLIITQDEISEIFMIHNKKLSLQDRNIIELKFLQYLENNIISQNLGIDLKIVNNTISRFISFYSRYKTKNINIDITDIENELSLHRSESVLTNREIYFASYYYGIPSMYNQNAIKLSKNELMNRMGISEIIFSNIEKGIKSTLKERKANLKKPDLICISRDKLKELLKDTHLPISEKERNIICHLLELNGYKYMTLEELSEKIKENKASIKVRYQRAIVSIYKYLNHEIEGIVDFEKDILPFLKYFGTSDRQKIIDYYKNDLTYDQITQKYNISKGQVFRDIFRLKNNIYELQNELNTKRFDFDYYLEVIDNPNLPFYGDLNLATKVFDLAFGMNGEERLSFQEIVTTLNLKCDVTTISRLLYDLMLSVCKFKDGIKKENTFSFEEVQTFYETYKDILPDYQKRLYQTYFKRVNKSRKNNGHFIKLSYYIMTDLIMDKYPNAFILKNATKEEVLTILRKYEKKINKRIKQELMARFGIKEREFMNGKEINHIYRLLSALDNKRLENSNQSLVLSLKQ